MLFRDKTKKIPFYNGILCLLKSQVQLREVHGVESCEKVAVCLKPFTDPVFNDLERKRKESFPPSECRNSHAHRANPYLGHINPGSWRRSGCQKLPSVGC